MSRVKICGWIAWTLLLLHGSAAMMQSGAYDQPYRPQVHFSPREHWTNDPNGLVYFEGEYHLFFQYNPFGDVWGHMSWGHAVSPDLLHWHELPVAIPEKDGEMIFTGSVVVDRENSSGFCTSGHACLVAIYTGHTATRQTQNIAYSLDRGRTWIRYEKNPVLDLHRKDFRDPSVSWNEAFRKWVMAVSLPSEHRVRFYASANLKSWEHLNDFGPAGATSGAWECPDLLRVPSASNRGKSIWALKVGIYPGALQGGSGEQYFLGNFDGKTFTPFSQGGAYGWTNYGKDDYCAISFNGLPNDSKPILIGWMSNWQYAAKLPTAPWRGQMSVPRQISYLKDEAGFALKQEPVIDVLRSSKVPTRTFTVNSSSNSKEESVTAPYELEIRYKHPSASLFGVRLYSDEEHWTELGFDTNKKVFYMDRTKSGVMVNPDFPVRTEAPLTTSRPYTLTLIVDRSSVEAFAQDGTILTTNLIFPSSSRDTIRFFPRDSKSVAIHGKLWELKSAWQQ